MLEYPVHKEFRPNVGIILLNKEGHVWLGQRTPPKTKRKGFVHAWQLPQGGMDKGETPEETAYRELKEETGITSVRLLTITPGWIAYEFPPEYVSKKKEKWRGQRQKWAVMLFEGDDSEVNLELHEEIEFVSWRWAPFEEMVDSVVPFKEGVYQELLQSFRPLAEFIGKSDL